MIIACIIISFIVGAMLMMCAIGMVAIQKDKKPRNKVHFYAARDKDGDLTIWMRKPRRVLLDGRWYGNNEIAYITSNKGIPLYNLNLKDFDNLKWEDEPVEVFLNLED